MVCAVLLKVFRYDWSVFMEPKTKKNRKLRTVLRYLLMTPLSMIGACAVCNTACPPMYPSMQTPEQSSFVVPEEEQLAVIFVNGIWRSAEEAETSRKALERCTEECLGGSVVVQRFYLPMGTKFGDVRKVSYEMFLSRFGYFPTETLLEAEMLGEEIVSATHRGSKVVVVAHSFGAHVVALALRNVPRHLTASVRILQLGSPIPEKAFSPFIAKSISTRGDPVVALPDLRFNFGWLGYGVQAPEAKWPTDTHNWYRGYLSKRGARPWVEEALVQFAKELYES